MSQSFIPSGNVTPSRFVKQDTTKVGGYVLQAGANDVIVGIAQQGTHLAPIAGLDDGYAGVASYNSILVYTEPDMAVVESGGAITTGDLLESDSNGKAVTSSTDGHNYGAVALESATAAGQLIRCKVRIGMRGA